MQNFWGTAWQFSLLDQNASATQSSFYILHQRGPRRVLNFSSGNSKAIVKAKWSA